MRYSVPIAGFWYGKERLQFLREQEGEYHYNNELRYKAKIKQLGVNKDNEIAEINKKHKDELANLEIELLKATGKWTPPPPSTGKADSVRFVESLLDGRWEGWMDDYVSNRLFEDITSAFESSNETFFMDTSKAILDKINTL